MKKYFLVISLFLSACSSDNFNEYKGKSNFSKNKNFNDFLITLEQYAQKNPYQNIDD